MVKLNLWLKNWFKRLIIDRFNNFLDDTPLTLSFAVNRFVLNTCASEKDFHETIYTYWCIDGLANGNDPDQGAGSAPGLGCSKRKPTRTGPNCIIPKNQFEPITVAAFFDGT